MTTRQFVAALALVSATAVTACSHGGGSGDEAPVGARARARAQLIEIGISKPEADCIIDRLGVETVVEAPDMATLADGGPYQEAAAKCLSNPTK